VPWPLGPRSRGGTRSWSPARAREFSAGVSGQGSRQCWTVMAGRERVVVERTAVSGSSVRRAACRDVRGQTRPGATSMSSEIRHRARSHRRRQRSSKKAQHDTATAPDAAGRLLSSRSRPPARGGPRLCGRLRRFAHYRTTRPTRPWAADVPGDVGQQPPAAPPRHDPDPTACNHTTPRAAADRMRGTNSARHRHRDE